MFDCLKNAVEKQSKIPQTWQTNLGVLDLKNSHKFLLKKS